MFRGLVFNFMLHRHKDQHDQRRDVRQHLEKLLRAAGQPGDIEIYPGQHAEEVSAPDRPQRTPGGEDHQCDRQPAERFNAAGAVPGTLLVIHHMIHISMELLPSL